MENNYVMNVLFENIRKLLTRSKLKDVICCTGVADDGESMINNCGVRAKSTELNVLVLLSSLTVLSEFLIRRINDFRMEKLFVLLLDSLSLFAPERCNC
jgi:hypothetical protein